MTRRNPPAKWVLPAVVDPPESICFQINVPNDRQHLAAFRGAMLSLAAAYKWSDDQNHTARLVAEVWRKVVDNIRSCRSISDVPTGGVTLEDLLSTQLRISPDDACIIQMWCIDHWEDWYNPSECIATGSGQARSRDGEQPGPGVTEQYCQTIQANNPYLYPVAVNTGDTITAGGMSGAWTDGVGGLISQWRCPDGEIYQLGACNGSQITDGTDPLPTEYHMALLAFIDGVYYPLASGSSFIVPFGITNENMLLVPNTADPTIARGSISACVTIITADAAPETATFAIGTGPNQITNGGVYTFTSEAGGAHQIDVTFSREVKLTIQSSSIVGPTCAGSCEYWGYYDTPGTKFFYADYPATPILSVPPTTGIKRWQIAAGNGGPQFTITIKVEF